MRAEEDGTIALARKLHLWEIDRIFDLAALDERDERLRSHASAVGLRLTSAGTEVGHQDRPRMIVHPLVGKVSDILARKRSLIQARAQAGGIHDLGAGKVHQICAWLHVAELLAAEQAVASM